MAQKTEKEDTEFKVVPETITQCISCGVIGNPASNNMCQTCVAASSATGGGGGMIFGEKSPKSRSSPEKIPDRKESSRDLKRGCSIAGFDYDDDLSGAHVQEMQQQQQPAAKKKREVNRCSGCRKKVGLTGFRCRCGELFCGEHRYSDRHDCSYDYKAAGRESIAKENPVFKAAKIIKL